MLEEPLTELLKSAEQRALALGHLLGPWERVEDVARRAVCVTCGRAVYARAEGKLSGIAGRAVGEQCTPETSRSPQ